MDKSQLRPGQLLAFGTIINRVEQGERYTSIVLPTRYGKSDVIRLSAIELWRRGLICTTLVLSPNILLRDQIVSNQKFTDTLRRYNIHTPGIVKATLKDPRLDFCVNGEMFISMTMQLFDRSNDIFCQWVDHMIYKTGRPPLIAVDESHTGSEDNSWGASVMNAVKKGAYAVLLTATAERSDGKIIPGFDCEVLETKECQVALTKPGSKPTTIWVDIYEGMRQRTRLQPHYEITFREAWAERPSPLCKIDRLPFDVDLSKLEDGDITEQLLLSELSPTNARKILGRVVRDRRVIREGCERLVTCLKYFKNNDPHCAAIVFVGNDDDPDSRTNEFAKITREALESIAPGLNVVIATASDGDEGTKKITQFASGVGDILVVKQMASLGLDVERLKVLLDLSPTRTYASYVQRMMRIATPYGHIRHGIVIGPDDVISRALFQRLVAENAGESHVVLGDLIESYEKERDEDLGPLFAVNGTSLADFEDTHFNRADKDTLPHVELLLDAIPELTAIMSHSEIATRLSGRGFTFTTPPEQARDTSTEADDLRAEINDLAKSLVNRQVRGVYSQQAYSEAMKVIFTAAKRAVRIHPATKLDQITDIRALQDLRIFLEKQAGGI